jgi:short-subunit dehydrogenase
VGFINLSAYCASKFGLVGLAESLALEVSEYSNIRVLTIFLGEVATKMWQDIDFSYYQRNKTKMLQPKDAAVRIAKMIFDTKTYKNGDSIEMYNNNISRRARSLSVLFRRILP